MNSFSVFLARHIPEINPPLSNKRDGWWTVPYPPKQFLMLAGQRDKCPPARKARNAGVGTYMPHIVRVLESYGSMDVD
jgi:hypothetical protein